MNRSPKVFCSHRSVDKPRVKEIAARLAEAGIDPWVDQWEILPGDDFVARINEGLATYDVGLLFLSKASLDSGWVTAEASVLIHRMIEDGKRVIPVMLDPDAPVPALLRPRVRLGFDQVEELVAAIYGDSDKPKVAPPRTRTRERTVRLLLRSTGPGEIAVRAELDGQPAAPEQATRLGADFAFSYQDFLRARLPLAHRSPAEAAVEMREAELARLGDAVGRVVFPGPVAAALENLFDEARARNEAVLLAFETADPRLLPIPFEAARLPGGRLPALEPGVRILRRHLGARAGAAAPLPGPLRILVAIGAPDEGKTKNTVLDIEAELQTLLDAVDQARRYGNAEVDILEVGHPDQIRNALLERSYHVLHLSGHGTAGKIELETEDGEPKEVSASELAGVIRAAHEPLPLVVLATCHGGVSESDTASLAQGLLEQGLPLVLAMQSTVSDWYATRLAGAFYGHLARRDVRLPSHALALARQDVEQERRKLLRLAAGGTVPVPEYATPSLFCAGDEIPLLDWDADKIDSPARPPQPVAGPVPLLKIGDLIGRRQELRELLWILLEDQRSVEKHGRKVGAVLQGLGGVGKSALAGRAMSRLADRGWRLAAVEGRWTLGELATRVGASLITDKDETTQKIATALLQPTLPDEARLQLLGQLLASQQILLVLDNFEDNLILGGGAFLDASIGPVLATLFNAAHRGKILITCRYPVPDSESWLVPIPLGPLSPAQTRKLFHRLAELKGQPPEVLGKILRLIGGHPRMLEYLDAILRKGTGRLPIVEKRLQRNMQDLGVKIEDLGGDLEQSTRDAIRLGAQDIFLDELLDVVLDDPQDREALEQTSVFPMPIDLQGLAFALSGAQEPAAKRIDQVRDTISNLVRTSLVTPLEEDSVWVHRWTAEALKARMEAAVFQEHCRRAGECLLWKIQNRQPASPAEAVRLLLQAAEFDKASQWASALIQFMIQRGQTFAAVSLLEDVLSNLPENHDQFPGFMRELADALLRLGLIGLAEVRYRQALQHSERRATEHPDRADYRRDLSASYQRMGDLLSALGQGEQAKSVYKELVRTCEGLVRDNPNNTDYQRNLSVSYDRMGDLLSALGQGEQAKTFYEQSLLIRERLARDEPNRADYQRDLSVSYNKLGDLLRALGQGEQAKTFYEQSLLIIERLARDEPNRADYQRDLSVSYNKLGDLLRALGQGEQAKTFYEQDLAIAERLARDEPNRTDYQRDLAVSFERMGDLLVSLSQPDGAKEFFQQALAIRERVTQNEPGVAEYQKELVVPLIRLSQFEPGKAASLLRRALSILTGLKERGILLPVYEPWIDGVQRMLNALESPGTEQGCQSEFPDDEPRFTRWVGRDAGLPAPLRGF